MSTIAHALVSALSMAFAMGWEILWPLILGFALSGVVQAVVTKGEMSRLLPDSSWRSILIATALGAASSSCSYAAVALARSIFRKGADFIAAMAFQFASTNLVLELGIIIAVLIGWQFVAAEFVGGLIMVALLTVMLRAVMNPNLIEEARRRSVRFRSDEVAVTQRMSQCILQIRQGDRCRAADPRRNRSPRNCSFHSGGG